VAGVAHDPAEARARLEETIRSGHALARLAAMIEAQGGNPRIVDDPAALPQAPLVEPYRATRVGVVLRVEPRRIGRAITALGGGRTKVDDVIDPAVGFVISVKPGDAVAAGEAIATIHARDAAGLAVARAALDEAIVLAPQGERFTPTPLLSHRVTASGAEPLAP
jgi:pyrimidine-nucleoside phosphorylase